MRLRSALAAAAFAGLAFACGRSEPRFDMSRPPAFLHRIDRLGTGVRSDEIRGSCFQPFLGRCTAEVLPSSTLLRKAVLRLAAGREARLTFTPAEGTPVAMMIDRGSDAKMRVRKSGGTLTVECTKARSNEGCRLVLVEER